MFGSQAWNSNGGDLSWERGSCGIQMERGREENKANTAGKRLVNPIIHTLTRRQERLREVKLKRSELDQNRD